MKECAESRAVFQDLLALIENMPPEIRAAQALNFSSKLLELAAFELAGDATCEEVGAMIRCAAELAEQSSAVASNKLSERPLLARVLQ